MVTGKPDFGAPASSGEAEVMAFPEYVGAPITDIELLREALGALKTFMSAADWDGGDKATLNITQLQIGLVQCRATITKLEQRLLNE